MLYQSKNPHGGDLYSIPICLDFSANTNPFGTPDSIKQELIKCADHLHQYPDPFCRDLVAAIADFEKLPKENIICGNGAAELIFSFCQALKPKHALELAPTFSEYSAALESVDCQVERYILKKENDFKLDENFLDFLQQGQWDVLFLCNPNNPTAQTISPKLLEKIVEICYEENIFLFLDECFQDITDDNAAYSMKNFLSKNPYLFILKAFTKSYGMAALRLGYGLCGNTNLLSMMSRSVQSWNVSLPAQKAGIAALKEKEFLSKTKTVIKQEREWLREQLQQLQFYVLPSQVNYIFFHSDVELHSKLLKQGIQIRDCSNYYGLSKGWYRIAVKLHEQNVELIQAIKKIQEGRDE